LWFLHATAVPAIGENPVLLFFFYRFAHLLSIPILPVFVFDGPERPRLKRNKTINLAENRLCRALKYMIVSFGFKYVQV
jgi:Holliday junction resolvase YEN1